MTADSYTNTSLSTARRCLREFELRYELQLEPDREADREVLQVGTTWHKAHDAHARGEDAYAAIDKHAPGVLWAEKLRRLFAAYGWYWGQNGQTLNVTDPEHQFDVVVDGLRFRGKNDGLLLAEDGRRGLLERKTTSDNLEDGSPYWQRLRMDPQVGIYAIVLEKLPDFILYDVVAKPSIAPKSLVKVDVARLEAEIKKTGYGTYYAEKFTAEELRPALSEARESVALYGARLTADIGDRPARYFARREVPRTNRDYASLRANLRHQIDVLEYAKKNDALYRNPDSCALFGICDFFGLCSNNIRPTAADPVPAGFRRRAKLHPELD